MGFKPGRGTPALGVAVGLAWIALTLGALLPSRGDVSRSTPALMLVLGVVVATVLGDVLASVVVALASTAALNLAFIPPYGSLKVDQAEDWVLLVMFLAVAGVISAVVAWAASRARAAEAREAEVRRLYDQLTAVVAEKAQLAEEAARTATRLRIDEQRAALLRSVSHDLRTPLATIRAVASDLRDGADYDEATRAELLSTVCDESERLDRIVANLLSLSRIEAGAFTPERQAVPVDELVAERMRRLAPLFRRARVEVDIPHDLPLADADYTQLDLVVTNLLENAARYAPDGSTVRIGARARDGQLVVSIADEGIGVPEYACHTVFEPFRRGEGSRSSGIGLAICKAIVTAHGGEIWVDRTIGGGATFRFTVPVRQAVPHSAQPAQPAQPAQRERPARPAR